MPSITSRIKHNRERLEFDLQQSGRWKFFSPVIFAQYTVTLPLIRKNATGDLIDIGCGRMPYRKEIIEFVTNYDGLDLEQTIKEIKYVCDAQDMNIVLDQSYHTAICLEVLEHVQNPQKVLNEINRVLKPQGMLILSVPHLSRLHNVPNDYYRFTSYGISFLLEQAGFKVLEMRTRGKLFTFLGHQLSTLLLSMFWRIPILQEIAYFLNKFLVTHLCFAIDQMIDSAGMFACGYTVLAKKV